MVDKIRFPLNEMRDLSGNLIADIESRKQPTEVRYSHHVPKIILIAAGLFLVLSLVCAGGYMTAGKLEQYEDGDIKYRYLKLQKDHLILIS